MIRRYKSITPVTDYSISQKIRVALIDDGHTALAVDSITKPIRALEEDYGFLEQRVRALEQEKVNWQTPTGVNRIIDARAMKGGVSLARWAIGAIGVLLLAAANAALGWYLGKHHG